MIAFKNLKEILDITLRWEQSLKDFYDVAEFALKSEASRKTVRLLRAKLEEKLAVLRGVRPEDFGKAEWIRFTLDAKAEELTPRLNRNSDAGEIFRHLLDFQGRLSGVYARIAETVVSRGQKELFESLARFKEEQVAEVRRLQDNYRPD
jgi:ferritin